MVSAPTQTSVGYLWCRQDQFGPLLCELGHSAGLQDGRGQITLFLLLYLLFVLLPVPLLTLAAGEQLLSETNTNRRT